MSPMTEAKRRSLPPALPSFHHALLPSSSYTLHTCDPHTFRARACVLITNFPSFLPFDDSFLLQRRWMVQRSRHELTSARDTQISICFASMLGDATHIGLAYFPHSFLQFRLSFRSPGCPCVCPDEGDVDLNGKLWHIQRYLSTALPNLLLLTHLAEV